MANSVHAGVFQSPQIVAANISGSLALLTAVYVHWRTGKSNRALEEFKNELASGRDDRNARRDYEYDARKRLYDEIEPLLFQLYEGAEKAFHRCRSLARTSRDGNLRGKDSWLRHDGYYLKSTLYNLFVPAALFRLIRRRMTFVDLDVDESIRVKYELVKLYFLALTDHFEFARLDPELPYQPDARVTAEVRRKREAEFMDQGLVYGFVDQIVDLMVVPGSGGDSIITFGQFDGLMSAKGRDPVLQQAVNVFHGFEASTRPILARTILGLATISHLLTEAARAGDDKIDLTATAEAFWSNKEVLTLFAWVPDAAQDFELLRAYFTVRFERIQARHPARP